MMMGRDGKEIFRRGGRVEKLPLKLSGQDTPEGALSEAARILRSESESLRQRAEELLRNASEKDEQAGELESAVSKILGMDV